MCKLFCIIGNSYVCFFFNEKNTSLIATFNGIVIADRESKSCVLSFKESKSF